MWFWQGMENKTQLTRVRNEELLRRWRGKNIQESTKKMKASEIQHTLRRDCLMRNFMKASLEGKKGV